MRNIASYDIEKNAIESDRQNYLSESHIFSKNHLGIT